MKLWKLIAVLTLVLALPALVALGTPKPKKLTIAVYEPVTASGMTEFGKVFK
jgi:hypothetical protein